ncbi:MAG: hypothetical protein CVV03_10160 [Firmicutes bacterium HGW-Firmicutes-8]|nr:MAG: hypothetical protein CVV03_10160 [Firmicutes bacterium HGW-Firmicutes-8]
MPNKHYTYIARCRSGVLYTGYTNDLERRAEKHNRGKGAKFTRGRGPVEIIYFEEFPSKSAAMVREAEIKRLTKPEKLKMIVVTENE